MTGNDADRTTGDRRSGGEYETVTIRKTGSACHLCEDYAARHASKPVAVVCCEGACLRGEIARQAANLVCHRLAPEKTVRVCLGGAFTKDTGQRALVRNAPRVIALEGCPIECASRMIEGIAAGVEPEVIVTDGLCDFDEGLFGADEMTADEIGTCAEEVAGKVARRL